MNHPTIKKSRNETEPRLFESLQIILKSEYSIILVFFIISIVMAIFTPRFATVSNILNIINRTSITGIVAIGMTYVIATGGIDLSVGGQVRFIGYVGAYMLLTGMPIEFAVFLMICLGIAIGMLNGVLTSYLNFPAFMVTLAMMEITKGLSLYISKGRTIFNLPSGFGVFGLDRVLGIPTPIWIFIFVALISHFGIRHTAYGRKILSVGSNSLGAWYSGINTTFIIFSAYAVSGATSAISSVITTSRLLSASPTVGTALELDAIAAVVIGGTSLAGGSGSIMGTVAGALIIEMIGNVMNLNAVNAFLQGVIKGTIILFALFIDVLRKGQLYSRH
jgi:ribose/xylose/arabinose/galactoside ABC-type transport system permease subunit